MKIKGYKYVVVYNHNKEIINPENFKDEINEEAVVEIYDTFGTAKGFNSLKQLEKFIEDNNLTFPSGPNTVNPLDKVWDSTYSTSPLRMFIDSINAMKLSIEQPEFVMVLKQCNIKLIVDSDYEGTWAYLEYIESEHKNMLETFYNAKFQYK